MINTKITEDDVILLESPSSLQNTDQSVGDFKTQKHRVVVLHNVVTSHMKYDLIYFTEQNRHRPQPCENNYRL